MPTPRLHPDRPLTPAEKQARLRERQAAYMRALEQALCGAADGGLAGAHCPRLRGAGWLWGRGACVNLR